MSNTRKITISMLMVAFLVLVGWDVWVVATDSPDTISDVLGSAPRSFVFGCGFVCGHLFWGRKAESDS